MELSVFKFEHNHFVICGDLVYQIVADSRSYLIRNEDITASFLTQSVCGYVYWS